MQCFLEPVGGVYPRGGEFEDESSQVKHRNHYRTCKEEAQRETGLTAFALSVEDQNQDQEEDE